MIFSKFISTYRYYILAFLAGIYSGALWKVSAGYTAHKYEKEKVTALSQTLKDKEASEERLHNLMKTLSQQQQQRRNEHSVITKEVIREVEKPVYRECRTTDDGVRLIEESIDNANKAITGASK